MGKECSITLLVFLVLHLNVSKGQFSFVLGCQKAERKALSKLKGTFEDPANRLSSWKGQNCCDWEGVRCDNNSDHVVTLDLRNSLSQFVSEYDNMVNTSNQLSALKLDPSLLELRHLKYLDLSGNYFHTSPIPGFIGSMKQLRYLNLSKAGFGGSVPPQLGNLTRLRVLDLGDDEGGVEWRIDPQFRIRRSLVMFPSSIIVDDLHWVSGLLELRYLDMSVIDLTEVHNSMQNLNKLPLLSELHLRGCNLGNAHLSNAFSNSTKPFSTLRHLDLSFNNLEGPFPHLFANLSSLRSLNLISNVLNGSIPLWLTNMGALESLILKWNSFSQVEGGTIMGIMARTPCKLKVLDLSENNVLGGDLAGPHEKFSHLQCDLESLDLRSNNITGTLPYWLGELKKLKFLNLKLNSLHGTIPPSIGNLSSLEELHLHGNILSGSIPSTLGGLSSLKFLDLSSNFLQGTVSESHFVNLSGLEILYLYDNSLKWEPSSDWMPPFQLTDLELGSCKIGGQLPRWIQGQKRLSWLDLSDTGISGNLLDWFWNMNLKGMNLSHNHITGPIPHFSSNLLIIDLSHNLFSGSLPRRLVGTSSCQLRNLEFLDLSKNELSGAIPDCWGSSKSLSVINLSFNKLTGQIPESIGGNSELSYLKLSNNLLEGHIPAALSNYTELKLLDLGENKLSGKIPNWGAESHPNLMVVRLRANKLSGVIPRQLCSLSQLQILDLAQNNLTGNVPHCFGHLSAMSLIQSASLSQDDPHPTLYDGVEENAIEILKGEELEYTTTLMLVENLDLSSNGLVGAIPEGLTNLTGLQGLNLSHNHLIGNIPKKIGQMRSLESLDLSNNNLSGTIPSSMSALPSLSHLNLSCNMLHGNIPTGNQLQTLDDPSIYRGNSGLCGDPLPNKCTSGQHHQQQQEAKREEEEDSREKVLVYIVIMLGFATGFWGVVGALLLKKRWRYGVFQVVDDVIDYLYVQVAVRAKRKRN